MNSFDTSLLVLETASLVSGLHAHEAIAQRKDVKIVLATVVGANRYLILATGPHPSLEAGLKEATSKLGHENQVVDHELFASFDRRVLESALALSQTKLEESLVVVEAETASGIFAVTEALAGHHGLTPIEIRIRRSGSGAYAYLTGKSSVCGAAALEAQTLLKKAAREGKAECFDKPSVALRSQFDFV